tara:strand:- start:1 stop:216 length:216 start_codon:yes stop_codon:yes gene_type:complete
MALEPIFAKINPFKINGLQISVFLHNQVNSRLPWYDFFLPTGLYDFFQPTPWYDFFFANLKRPKKKIKGSG